MSGRHQPSDDETNQPPTAPSARSELDVILRAVNHPYRRHTLWYLDQVTVPQSVADITAVVSERTDQQPPDNRQQLAIALIHHHLPHLNNAGLIKRTGRDLVIPTETAADAVQVLDAATEYFD
jgi:DNA-binding transcriptional ArsR family regulator